MANFDMSRRGFLGAMAAMMASGPQQALAKLALHENPYPWITNPKVHAAMLELDTLYDDKARRFKLPDVLDDYVMNRQEIKGEDGDAETLFKDPFWKLLKSQRSEPAIRQALAELETIFAREAEKQPRVAELLKIVKDATGDMPSFLRLEPEKQEMFRQLRTMLQEKDIQFITPEEGFSYLEKGVKLLRDYHSAYVNGTLRDFENEHYRLEKPKSRSLKGNDYQPSTKEKESAERALKHFLNLGQMRIVSNLGKGPMAYQAQIHTCSGRERMILDHIKYLIGELFPARDPSARLLGVSETKHPLTAEMPMAYAFSDTKGFLTISDPPRALMEMIEEAKSRKTEVSFSR